MNDQKRIVFVVYHNCNTEERSREILQCCCMLGKVDYVSYVKPEGFDDVTSHLVDKSKPDALLQFLILAKKVIKSVQPDIVFLHDNDCSVLIPFIRKKCKKCKIVYDSSELYINLKGAVKQKQRMRLIDAFKVKLTSFRSRCEKRYLKYVDIVIAANIERAKIMKEYFQLKDVPLVFNNIHRIDEPIDLDVCLEKYDGIFDEGKFNILFAGGVNQQKRLTLDFINEFIKLPENTYNLVILGAFSEIDKFEYGKLIKGRKNIHYCGFVSRGELKYCIRKSQISVVTFNNDTYNNRYCASGKCYESLFEGVPIVACQNLPLKNLCEQYHIGISDNNFSHAIINIRNNYDFYVKCVKEYIDCIDYENRISELKLKIEETLGDVAFR